MAVTDRDLAIIGIFLSILPTVLIVYFDWRRRRAERYSKARDWVTRCLSHMRGLIELSTQLLELVTNTIGPNVEALDEVKVEITKPSQLFLVNKAQDIFLSRDSLRQLATAWDDLNLKSRNALDEIYPLIFNEDDLLKLHSLLQIFQDSGMFKSSHVKEWSEINNRFIASLQKANMAMTTLRKESRRSFPVSR